MVRDFRTFSRACAFFLLTLSLVWSSLFFSSLCWLLPPLRFNLSILSEIWLRNFLRQNNLVVEGFLPSRTAGVPLRVWPHKNSRKGRVFARFCGYTFCWLHSLLRKTILWILWVKVGNFFGYIFVCFSGFNAPTKLSTQFPCLGLWRCFRFPIASKLVANESVVKNCLKSATCLPHAKG